MPLNLLCHINADGDLLEAWLKHYLRLGVERFRLVVRGPPEENRRLLELKDRYPVVIEDTYEGPFESEQKKNRLDAILRRTPDQWVLVVDSDEFVEFPYGDIPETIRKLEYAHANVMIAPMLQRMKVDGTLDSPVVIDDPFAMFPLCSEDLYQRMGSDACLRKCPLFFCNKNTQLLEEGNHSPPVGAKARTSAMLGVTHHFKFRQSLLQRLDEWINSDHAFRHESVRLDEYLEKHSKRLPLEGTFAYSREELFRRGLLKKLSLRNHLKSVGRSAFRLV